MYEKGKRRQERVFNSSNFQADTVRETLDKVVQNAKPVPVITEGTLHPSFRILNDKVQFAAKIVDFPVNSRP